MIMRRLTWLMFQIKTLIWLKMWSFWRWYFWEAKPWLITGLGYLFQWLSYFFFLFLLFFGRPQTRQLLLWNTFWFIYLLITLDFDTQGWYWVTYNRFYLLVGPYQCLQSKAGADFWTVLSIRCKSASPRFSKHETIFKFLVRSTRVLCVVTFIWVKAAVNLARSLDRDFIHIFSSEESFLHWAIAGCLPRLAAIWQTRVVS